MGRRETARALDEARESNAAWELRMAAANRRMSGLERELAAARQQLARRESEFQLLEKSLDWSIHENVRLADQLKRRAAAADNRLSQLAEARWALKAAGAERHEADGKAREQIAALNAELEAVTARAAAAEKLVSETQKNWLASSAENSRAQSRLAALQGSLQDKEAQLQTFRQAQLKLVELITSREAALLRAEARIADLTEEWEAKTAASASQASNIETASRGEERGRLAAETAAEVAISDDALLRRDLDSDDWLFGGAFYRAA